jgi:hypothetical protein
MGLSCSIHSLILSILFFPEYRTLVMLLEKALLVAVGKLEGCEDSLTQEAALEKGTGGPLDAAAKRTLGTIQAAEVEMIPEEFLEDPVEDLRLIDEFHLV